MSQGTSSEFVDRRVDGLVMEQSREEPMVVFGLASEASNGAFADCFTA